METGISSASINKFRPHSDKQDKCLFSEKKVIILACGIQFGKTTVGAMRTKIYMHRYTDPSDNFIITAPTYKIMQQATLPEFLRVMKGWGDYSKADSCFRMYNGGTCYFRTATDPDSVVGITNVRHIWGDESGLYPLYFHENLQARASFKQCPIIYTTSPYSLNWIYTDYIRPIKKKGISMPDVELVQARSEENPYFPREEYERKKESMDPRRFNMIYGGEFNKVEGLVYDCFDDDVHVIEKQTIPQKAIVVAGVDWGYTNPAVILVFAVTPDDGVWLVDEWYQTNKTINEMTEAAERYKKAYGIERFYCDPSSPANIAEFNKKRLTAIPADNDIRSGVDAGYEMIKADRFHVFKGKCPNFLDEISIYHYPQVDDIGPDKDVKDQMPVKQYDHAQDAFRYVMLALKKTKNLKKSGPIQPGVAQSDLRLHAADKLILRNLDEDFDW